MASTPVSPKVHTAGAAAAVVALVMYLLDTYVHAVAVMPAAAKGAVLVIVTGAVTWLLGYAVPDALRVLGAKFDNDPETAPKGEAQ